MKAALAWVRSGVCAATLANLAHAFLQSTDADRVERLLLAGHHDRAANHFCERFSARHFPLDYASTGRGELIGELTNGIQHDGYGENWEEMGDMWSLKPVFLLSWALMEDPYPPDDEFVDDDVPDNEQAKPYRLCDEAREGIAHVADLPVRELFDGVPVDGFSPDHLRSRFTATCWEPLLWAGPWLWRFSGNPFLDRDGDDYSEPEPWSASSVFRLAAEYREALRIMRAIDEFDSWLLHSPAERARAAVHAALGPPAIRTSTLLDLPIVECRVAQRAAPAS